MNIPKWLEIEQTGIEDCYKGFDAINRNSPEYQDVDSVPVDFDLTVRDETKDFIYLSYESNNECQIEIEIDVELDRIIACTYTDENNISCSIEIVTIKDLENITF